MDLTQYGPFATVVGIAGALIATFSILLLKMIGKTNNWTWMTDNPPSRIVTVGARMIALGLMAFTFIIINKSNFYYFAGASIICGIIGFIYIDRFNHLRKLHVVTIPVVGPNGQPLMNVKGKPVEKNLVIGTETNMNREAKTDLKIARTLRGGVSLEQFMSGYGNPVNDPGTIWDRGVLASISHKLTMALIYIALCGVMVIFWAAFAIEVFTRAAPVINSN